jgi:tryptophan-rich sensory protein
MIGIAAGLVWLSESPRRRPALWLFAVQLVLNAAWSPVFFGAHAIRWALVVLTVLWCAAVATAVAFFRVDRTAGAVLVPYLAWITFALVLNATIVAMN